MNTPAVTDSVSASTIAATVVSPAPSRRPVRTGPARLRAATLGAGLLLVLGMLVSTSVGETQLTVSTVLDALLGRADTGTTLVVLDLRLPRVVTGALVGTALGLSGAVLQSLARNPLASPDVLGINAGAAVAAVAVVILAGSAGGISGIAAAAGIPTAAICGALVSGTLLHVLAVRGRALDPMRLVLVGVGISAVGTSLVSWLLTLGDVTQVGPAITWLAGSVHAATWARALAVALTLAAVVPLLALLQRRLWVMALGDDVANSLGVRVNRSRSMFLVLATCLAGAATATAGAVGFVALAAPQLAQRLARTPQPPLAASAASAGALLVWADLAARQGLRWAGLGATELPVGLLTAAVGAPYLLVLVTRHARSARRS